MSDLRFRTKPHPTDPSQGDLINATGMVEIARRVDTPKSRAFLEAFHAAEADVARESPGLGEAAIRAEAVARAVESLGHRVHRKGVT